MPDLIIRAPNHLGDLVMALPAIRAVQPADVLVARWLAPVLELAQLPGEVIPLERGRRAVLAAARELRRRRYERGILLAPSFSAALVFALGAVKERRGDPTDGRGLLVTDPVPAAAMAAMHRSATYHVLASGRVPDPLPAPRLHVPEALRAAWAALSASLPGGVAPADARRTVGIFPGSNASSRRWEQGRFAELVGRLAARGERVVVLGGPTERDLTAAVAGRDGVDAGGRTDLPLLAAALAACDVVVTNDSGPMHLAAAVGTPVVAVWGAGDPARTRPLGDGHLLLRRSELPCAPCVRNDCPRTGRGYVLPEAERECLRLIGVDDVDAALAVPARP